MADPIAVSIAGPWLQADAGAHSALRQSWASAFEYMLQRYFDFSGYSENPIGAARLFGVRHPLTFNSPLRATSIIDDWSRWHVTLTGFLTAYALSPLTLALIRKRAKRNRERPAHDELTEIAELVALSRECRIALDLAIAPGQADALHSYRVARL